jgi:L-alanine-DL-glutamate epimerase-like enolase superfamily enzyme
MEAGSIDVCNFEASWSGGPTAWLWAAAIAASYEVDVAALTHPLRATRTPV